MNAFGESNFKLGFDLKNIILGKNRSRENAAGFGSPTLRKINLQREKSKDAFDSIMAKHGLLKDLNNLNSFNDFCKQSPLKHQKSLDQRYHSPNPSISIIPSTQFKLISSKAYSFPFQRRARSASPPKDPEINSKIASSFSPQHKRENTSAVDHMFDSVNDGKRQ